MMAILTLTACATAALAAPEKITLWPENAPLGDGQFDTAVPTVTIHKPVPEKAAGTEGNGIAKCLGQHGIAGIVLGYRLPRGRSFVPLLDAQHAIRTTRAKAKEWLTAQKLLAPVETPKP